MAEALMTVEETGRALGVSRSTVWRRIQRGELPTVRRGGRRMVLATALRSRRAPTSARDIPALADDHPIFRLVGAGRGGGRPPGARDKHAILDE
jgi:excisionase family DNA binding protein